MIITKRAKQEIDKLESFRIGLTTKGCKGYSYEFSVTPQPNDNVLPTYNFTLYVDKKISMLWLLEDDSIILDYRDEAFFKGFEIINPEELSRCGCGKSFYLWGNTMIAGIIIGIFIVLGTSWYTQRDVVVIQQPAGIVQDWENLESKGE